jgi:hypothetical protein
MFGKFTVSGTIGLVVLAAALSTGTALAGGTTPQGLKADGLRLQALARAYGQTDGSTPQGLKADGLRWQGIARAYESRPAASYYTPAALRAQGLRWNALVQMYRSQPDSTVASSGGGFDWGDAGVGAAGGLGFAVFAVAAVIFARHLRRAKLAL